MSCFPEKITNEIVVDLIQTIGKKYKGVEFKTDNQREIIWVSFEIGTNLYLKFIVKEDYCEILIIKELPDYTIIYRNDETQIIYGRRDFSNVKVIEESKIVFDESANPNGSDETREERNMRKEDSYYFIGENRTIDFETEILVLDLIRYISNECVLEYFRENEFVKINPQVVFIDIPIEQI